MAKTRTPQSTHEFLGQADGELVAEWLRLGTKHDPVRRVVDLERRRVEQFEDTRPEIFAAIGRAAHAWRYKLLPAGNPEHPEVRGPLGWTAEWRPFVGRRGVPRQQIAAFNAMIRLGGLGLLHRVRPCARKACGAYFFAKLENQTFHSDECRRLAQADDADRRMKRAAYMREHRATLKKLRSQRRKGKRK